ncbi:MAG TPA: RcpC/CpaB family pilus assembly protein, partial [Acidimicrobiales bacterium]|nr:RcpC/CpaB family pilus assembly protein [Acidimicrobiales bacterium]
ELVQASDVVRKRSGPDEREVSFSLETARAVAGTLRSGERVDVLATFGTGTASYTTAIVRHARVLVAEGGSGALGDSRNETVTLAVTDPEEALAVTHAVNVGEVTLVRSTGTTAPAAGPPPVYVAPAARDESGG